MGMMQLPMKQPKDKSVTKPPAKSTKTEAAFDMWLQRGLHQLFDSVANEPIPDDLLRLIEEDRKK
jgi:hypothetical protein